MQVHGGAQVVDVGHKDVLLALRDQLIQQARVVEAGVDVAVTRRVPGLCVLPAHAEAGGHGEEGLFVDAGVPEEGGGAQSNLHSVVFLLHVDSTPFNHQNIFSRG